MVKIKSGLGKINKITNYFGMSESQVAQRIPSAGDNKSSKSDNPTTVSVKVKAKIDYPEEDTSDYPEGISHEKSLINI